MAFHFYADAGTPIFDSGVSGNAPTSFTDLVLPASVPLECVARLRFVHRSTALVIRLAVRPNGNTTIELPPGNNTPAGAGGCSLDDIDGACVDLMVATEDRTIEWVASVAQPVDVYLVGYHDATIVDPTCSGSKALNAQSISTSWTNNLNLGLAAARVIALFEVQSSSSTDKVAWRPSDETEDVLLEYDSAGAKTAVLQQPNGGSTAVNHVVATMTGPDGLVDASSVVSSLTAVDVYVHAVISIDDHYNTSLSTYNVTTSYTNLDMSSVVGAVDGVAVIKLRKSSLSNAERRVGFRPDGSSETVDILSAYDAVGGCNRVMLIDFDEHYPSISNLTPSVGASNVTTGAGVSCSFSDAGGDIQVSTIWMKINGAYAVLGGVLQAGYSGSVSAAGVSISVNGHPSWSQDATVTAEVSVTDSQGSTTRAGSSGSWYWTTYHPIVISNLNPPNGSSGNSGAAIWSCSFSDAGGDVDLSTLYVTHDGDVAISGGAFQGAFSGSISSSGFSVNTPPYHGYGVCSIYISVYDVSDWHTTLNWSFGINIS